MKHIEVSGRLVLREDEYYTPDDGEIIKLSYGDNSIYVKAVRKRYESCKICVFHNKFCTALPLKCTHHYYIDLNPVLENL